MKPKDYNKVIDEIQQRMRERGWDTITKIGLEEMKKPTEWKVRLTLLKKEDAIALRSWIHATIPRTERSALAIDDDQGGFI